MEIRGGGAGPAVGIRRGEEFIPFAAPIPSSEAESPRPEPPPAFEGPACSAVRRAGRRPSFVTFSWADKKR